VVNNIIKYDHDNIFYAQSGGATAVINATACGVIETAKKYGYKVYAGKNGIVGAIVEDLIDTSRESDTDIFNLRYTPGSVFGSCRYKLSESFNKEYENIIKVFRAHRIGYFFYNGGGDSQDTTYKISRVCKDKGYKLICIGIPKTIDNDLFMTDTCPGFGSVAKFIATAVREIECDVRSMASSSTKVFVLEVMGRNAGWIAAAAGLARSNKNIAPHIILFPEILYDEKRFLSLVRYNVQNYGYCITVVAEGVKYGEGYFENQISDAFGHKQLGGIAHIISNTIKNNLGYKCRWAIADYLQRSARHIASKTDVDQAYALGKATIDYALKGINDVMMVINRIQDTPYTWNIGYTNLENVINRERKLPLHFISRNGFHISQKCKKYLSPLIMGEDFPPFVNGLPYTVQLKNILVSKKLKL